MTFAKTTAPTSRILVASLVGTTIEFFDFYIYATAAVIVFPKLFFPAADATSATLESLATFALAFFARPLGAALFGHFGDRKGRKATLVAALMTMGPSTVAIGLLPTYHSIGILAPILLALFRLGQGLGLGGEWGGAVGVSPSSRDHADAQPNRCRTECRSAPVGLVAIEDAA
ncbi:MAG TPA: MFS transporter [Puia sp.]|jgi:MFS family permease|nr:MFS transporter [Puia sp.]